MNFKILSKLKLFCHIYKIYDYELALLLGSITIINKHIKHTVA